MNTDKNTIIGFVLLAGLFFTYFWYTNKQQAEITAYKQHVEDSLRLVKAANDKAIALKNPIKGDTTLITLVFPISHFNGIGTLRNR